MSIQKFISGSTTLAKIGSSNDLKNLFPESLLNSETIIIKPNWVSTDPADFTDASTLEMLFRALDSRIVIIESYILARSLNLSPHGLSFRIGEREVDWKWLLKGDGWNWLIENPDWEWFKNGPHWEHIRLEDQEFLDRYGFSELFERFNVTYLNVTEEVWNARNADPALVKRVVDSRYGPLKFDELYRVLPAALYNLRGATLISLARLKMYASYTIKNFFGLIPDPLRPWWHGPQGDRIVDSILDMNKLYHAFFKIYGICEAIYTSAFIAPDGKHDGIYCGRYNVTDGSGVIAMGPDLVSLDAFLLDMADPEFIWIADLNRDCIARAAKDFGVELNHLPPGSLPEVRGWFLPSLD